MPWTTIHCDQANCQTPGICSLVYSASLFPATGSWITPAEFNTAALHWPCLSTFTLGSGLPTASRTPTGSFISLPKPISPYQQPYPSILLSILVHHFYQLHSLWPSTKQPSARCLTALSRSAGLPRTAEAIARPPQSRSLRIRRNRRRHHPSQESQLTRLNHFQLRTLTLRRRTLLLERNSNPTSHLRDTTKWFSTKPESSLSSAATV